MPRINYFAYGSNLLTERLRRRVPSARPLGVGQVDDHRLSFHMAGEDGSGKCDAYPAPGHRVWGAVYQIDSAEKPRLDAVESLGCGYEIVEVTVEAEDGPWQAFMYRTQPQWIDASLAPYAWYKNFVLAGAREKALPADYVRVIAAVAARPDPDAARDRLNRGILEAGGGLGFLS